MTGPYREIIVGTDGSATASCAVAAATTVARALGVPLTIATAWYRRPPDPPVPSEAVEYPGGAPGPHEARWAEQTATAAAVAARQAGLSDVRTATPEGHPADALLDLAEARRDALLVVGTVGLTDRTERLLGNVPHQITHHATRDVLLVHTEDCTGGYRWDRAALATDGSETAARAVQRGVAFARAVGATPVLLTVAGDETRGERILARVAEQLGLDDLEREVVVGRTIVDALVAAARSYDLLVMGNKGMSGPSRLLGSVANHVTHALPTDILLVNTTR